MKLIDSYKARAPIAIFMAARIPITFIGAANCTHAHIAYGIAYLNRSRQ
ncbi:hypothetical protein RSAG8_01065, partial [Rhizoctonia solani AG-8 WAC10335]